MATTSSCNFHPYSKACSCYNCYKSRGAMSEPFGGRYYRPYGRREADLFGEVSRGLGEPTRLTSGGIRAKRHHQLARAPVAWSDDFIEDFIRRLEPKIELVIERAFELAKEQHRVVEHEKTDDLEEIERVLPHLTVEEDGESQKDDEEAALASTSTIISTHALVQSVVVVHAKTSMTTDSTQKRISSKANVAAEVSKLAFVARKLSTQDCSRNSRVSRPRKLIQWRIPQFKYHRKSRQPLLKSRKRLEHSR